MNKNFAMKDSNRKVVITCNQNVVTARIYDGNAKVAIGVATCSPEDEFDFKVGAELAMKRAFGEGVKKNGSEWVTVNRKPVPGDYVRLIGSGFSFDKVGDIMKVHSVVENCVRVKASDRPNVIGNCADIEPDYLWNYLKSEVEVVEKKEVKAGKESKVEFRKITRTPKSGDYVNVIQSDYSFDDPNTFLKIDKVFTDIYGNAVLIYVNVKSYPNSKSVQSKFGDFNGLLFDNLVPYALSMNELEFYEKIK